MQSAASDLALLIDAAREAGAIARARFGSNVKVWNKTDSSPVTEVDLELDRTLEARLRPARPDYGWLSEEQPDTNARLSKARTFIVDPIDGTRAFIEGEPEFCISLGVSDDGAAFAGVIYNPITEEMFAGGAQTPATLNGAAIAASDRAALEDAHLIGRPALYDPARWPEPWPPLRLSYKKSLAYRMALVAAGRFDGAVLPGFKFEWDIAAGCAIVAAAGGDVGDPWGAPVRLNQADPRAPGVVIAGRALWPRLIERTKAMPHPSTWPQGRATPLKKGSES